MMMIPKAAKKQELMSVIHRLLLTLSELAEDGRYGGYYLRMECRDGSRSSLNLASILSVFVSVRIGI